VVIETDINDTIKNVLDGSRIHQELLYNEYSLYVKKYLISKYGSFDVDDNVLEIMSKIFENLDKYDSSKSKFKSWVITISNRHIIDKWRKIENKQNVVYFEDNNYSYDYNNDSDEKQSNDFAINTDVIDNLTYYTTTSYGDNVNFIKENTSKTDFDMLNMKYVEGYNYAEIGEKYNITSTTASNRVNYIKTVLSKKYCDFE
jgi:RNA polymerase sigma-70 factor (ECF subfamily)